jgi:hypothetical protein
VDNSQGSGATPSCASIVNSLGVKVGEYANPTQSAAPREMARDFVPLCKLFADSEGEGAWLAWEKQGPGVVFGINVLDLGYRRVYAPRPEGRITKGPKSDTPGWNSSPQNKLSLITAYRDALREGLFVNRSERAVRDTLQFQFGKDGFVKHAGEESGKDYSGARVNHGDMVIADALAWLMLVRSGGVDTAPTPEEVAALTPATLAGRMKFAHNAASESPWCQE